MVLNLEFRHGFCHPFTKHNDLNFQQLSLFPLFTCLPFGETLQTPRGGRFPPDHWEWPTKNPVPLRPSSQQSHAARSQQTPSPRTTHGEWAVSCWQTPAKVQQKCYSLYSFINNIEIQLHWDSTSCDFIKSYIRNCWNGRYLTLKCWMNSSSVSMSSSVRSFGSFWRHSWTASRIDWK